MLHCFLCRDMFPEKCGNNIRRRGLSLTSAAKNIGVGKHMNILVYWFNVVRFGPGEMNGVAILYVLCCFIVLLCLCVN